ncbi:methylated-DNA--[protein]-cysteine S-methyltransferase [Halopseudomonas salegens]|uniref:methylated-DNA--[protein]-cysteine S-methyltransferase n=1 Tax=Halopseudomonas salegens TaxID=1434072 RepID=A0A1H2EQN5_9GAMM|nr:methylated-DNA--[protein]-cysteine S-methyltransferase [Halopseudomonas salegens]SDT97263.1 AraC family transcriptional regulator, regulatory protein of adaptative response / methylated-DNA-[protein]-cysteine methyltransferase [Halopseudomonas salegens]
MSSASSIHYLCQASSLGTLLVAADDNGLRAIQLADSTAAAIAALQARFPQATLHVSQHSLSADLERILTWLEHPRNTLQLEHPLAPRGTAFQQQVWHALQQTRPGERLSYQQLATRLGKPTASRAVAGACAANPLALVIPCHRVVRSDGGISGYRWGITRKQALLQREQTAGLLQAS